MAARRILPMMVAVVATVSRTTTLAAAPGCPCMDSSEAFLSRSNCVREDGVPGVWVSYRPGAANATGACYPVSFGANRCAAHDEEADLRCRSGDNPPGYCREPWCYVDGRACKESTEFYFLSDQFQETGLYYSYSTCNGTEDSWRSFASTNRLEGVDLEATVPAIYYPNHYKFNEAGEVADWTGTEYRDDGVPWTGWQLEYFNKIVEISNIHKVAYTHRSRGSDVKSPSSWTAAVHDVQSQIACLAVSNFWITSERLKLAMFTTPIAMDKLYLFIKSPTLSSRANLAESVQKTLAPFETSVWIIIAILLVVLSLLTVFFANPEGELSMIWQRLRSREWKEASLFRKTKMFLKMWLESLLLKTTYAVTQSAGINTHNSLAQKFINVGFAFLGLILISAYTANLAAFLTVSLADQIGYIKSMEDAVSKGITVGGFAALQGDLSRDWPSANFVFFENIDEQLAAYDAGDIQAIIYSESDLLASTASMTKFCDRELVMTGRSVLEKPVAFPVCSEIAAGISHWIFEAEKQGITFSQYQEANRPMQSCPFGIPDQTGDGDMARLSVQDFALPLFVMFVCIGLAIWSHVWEWNRDRKMKKVDGPGPVIPQQNSTKMLLSGIPPGVHTANPNNLDHGAELEIMLGESKRMTLMLERMQAAAGNKQQSQRAASAKDIYV